MGVIDKPIVIEFSEPMAEDTLAAAFPEATLSFGDGGRRVEIALELPFVDQPTSFAITVPTTVTDRDGVALAEPFEASVTLAKVVSKTIELQLPLSGAWASECEDGSNTAAPLCSTQG